MSTQWKNRGITGLIIIVLCVILVSLVTKQNETLGASGNPKVNQEESWTEKQNKATQLDFTENSTSVKTDKVLNGSNYEQPIPAKSANDRQWTVKPGDSLFVIAKKFGVTVEQIKQNNHLTSDRIYVGQTLKIPSGNTGNFFYYTVKPGESLYQLALRFGVTVAEIQQKNSLNSTQIKAGQIIKIPGTEPYQQQNTEKTLAQIIKEKGIDIVRAGLRIFVDKSDKILSVSAGNVWLKNYPVELGDNGLGDKSVSGDHKTPEGTFYVSELSVLTPTDEYLGSRWMRLSYPNVEDAKRGLSQNLIDSSTYNQIVTANNQKSIPPQRTALGGGVGIHGGSTADKGKNWTWGCVGLSDKDVEEIFQYVIVGTPVVIQY